MLNITLAAANIVTFISAAKTSLKFIFNKKIVSLLVINNYIEPHKIEDIMQDRIQYEMEFVIQSSPSLLYNYLSTPSGLSEWYADNVNSRGELFTFIWEGSEEQAKLLTKKSNERVEFRWMDDVDDEETYYFELRIQVDEITKDVSLMITDFAEDDEVEEGKMLWENMVSNLKQILGSS